MAGDIDFSMLELPPAFPGEKEPLQVRIISGHWLMIGRPDTWLIERHLNGDWKLTKAMAGRYLELARALLEAARLVDAHVLLMNARNSEPESDSKFPKCNVCGREYLECLHMKPIEAEEAPWRECTLEEALANPSVSEFDTPPWKYTPLWRSVKILTNEYQDKGNGWKFRTRAPKAETKTGPLPIPKFPKCCVCGFDGEHGLVYPAGKYMMGSIPNQDGELSDIRFSVCPRCGVVRASMVLVAAYDKKSFPQQGKFRCRGSMLVICAVRMVKEFELCTSSLSWPGWLNKAFSGGEGSGYLRWERGADGETPNLVLFDGQGGSEDVRIGDWIYNAVGTVLKLSDANFRFWYEPVHDEET